MASPLELALDQRLSLRVWKALDARNEPGKLFAAGEHVWGLGNSVVVLGEVLVRVLVADVVQGAVADDRVEPGADVDLVVAAQRLVRTQQGLLNDVLGSMPGNDAPGEGDQAGPVAPHDLFEGGLVAGAEEADEPGIGLRAQRDACQGPQAGAHLGRSIGASVLELERTLLRVWQVQVIVSTRWADEDHGLGRIRSIRVTVGMDRGLAVVLTALVGGLIALQAPINSVLGHHTGSLPAALVSFLVGTFILLAVVVVIGDTGGLASTFDVRWYYLVGGVLGAAYVTVALISVRTIGAGGVAAATITGQLTTAVVIDRFGLLGLERTALTTTRLLGVGLLLAGTYLVVR